MRLLTYVLCLALTAVPALARPPLRDVPEIDNGLMAVAIADEIRKTCDGIDARMFKALSTLSSLKRMARARGYSDAEIDDYVTSKAEKARMRAKAEAYLASRGVSAKDRTALCAFGRAEMAAGSAIGQLLK